MLPNGNGHLGGSIAAIPFGTRMLGPGHPVIIIAEVGINHEGSVDVCARMIEEAARAGADSVKLQTMDADENYCRNTESYGLFSKSALTQEETSNMFELIRAKGMEPFTTSGDFATIDWVDRLNPVAHKISSGLFTQLPAIRHAARSGRPLLMSTGMADVDDIDTSVQATREAGGKHLALFQCTSQYPAPIESLNLLTIPWLVTRYQVPAGFSDHSIGSDAAMVSVGLGACMLEKHFTLDSTRPRYDHRLSLEPDGFAELVKRVRAAEAMLGDYGKPIGEKERAKALEMHRILVARKDIAAGEIFDAANLGLKRPIPGTSGLHPRHYEAVLGRVATRALKRDEAVVADVIEGNL